MTLQVYHYMADCGGNFTENLPTSQRPPVPGEENEATSTSSASITKERSPSATPRRSTLLSAMKLGLGCMEEDEAPLGFEPEGSASVTPPYTRWTESLHALLSDEDGICLFKQFLVQEKAQDPLLFWLATEGFKKKSADDPKRTELAKVIYKKFIKADGQQAVKISSTLRTNIAGMVRSSVFDETLFDSAQAEVEENIRESTYPSFLKSDIYVQYINNGGISPKSSECSSSGDNSRVTGYLPTLPEDAELTDIPSGENAALNQGQVPLTMEMLMKTSFHRHSTNKTQEGCYLKGSSARVLSPYHPSFTSFAPAVSTNDSELQSLSSDAISDDTMSLTDSSVDGGPIMGRHQQQQQRRRQYRAMKTNVRQNGRVASFPPFPIAQRPPKDVQPMEPAEFARILTEKLERVLRQRETEERLTARLRKVEEEELDLDRTSSAPDAPRLSAMFEKGALPEDDPNSILDDHFSRVFKDSARHTPGDFSPRSRSPDRAHRAKVSLGDGNGESDDGMVEDEFICLEKQLGKKEIPLSGLFNLPGLSYTTMQLSTAFDCWSDGEPNKSKRVYKESWLNWIFAGGFILALFSPIAMSFFIEKNPPETDEQGVERLSLVSDLPLGLKYVTCFWARSNIFVSATRWTLFVLLFMMIQYVPVLISFLTDMDGFMKRSFALYNTGPQSALMSVVWHVLINVIFLLAAIVLMERFFRDEGQEFLEPLLRERARTSDGDGGGEATGSGSEVVDGTSGSDDGATRVNQEDSNTVYKHMVMIEAPTELWAPSTSLVSSQAFFYYMRWRARMGVDIKAWRFVIYGWLWGRIAPYVGAPPDNPRTVLCAVIVIVAFPFYLPFGLIFFAFNTLPLLYCMTRCLQTALSNDVKCSELMFSLLIAVASIAWFFKFVATFVYIAELLGYSFMGFVVNADVVGPTVLVVVIIVGYIVGAITGFYDGYCVLFSKVMEVAEAVDGAVESKRAEGGAEQVVSRRRSAAARRRMVRQQARASSAKRQDSIELQPSGGQRDNGAATPPPPEEAADAPLVSFNAKAIPTLELKLFWLIVEKYRPIRVQVASTVFQLLVIIISIGFGMSILAIADSLSNLSTTVELFASVIIAGVVPTVLLALKSPASQDCYDKAKERQIEADVFHFSQHDQLKNTAP